MSSDTKRGRKKKGGPMRSDIITNGFAVNGSLPSAFRDDGISPQSASPVMMKPREERSYKEFYPSLELKDKLPVTVSGHHKKTSEGVLIDKCDVKELPAISFRELSPARRVSKKHRIDPKYHQYIAPSEKELEQRVEYDLDDQDKEFLDLINIGRKSDKLTSVSYDTFELVMDQLEKMWFMLTKDMTKPEHVSHDDAYCSICQDGEADNSNAIIFCDGCNVAVHQECYGVPFIPEGQWLCRKCMLVPEGIVNCVFCPNTDGAFKQTTSNQWAHLLCALWIPEVSIVNHVYAEPIDGVEKVPKSRWKLTCYLCKRDDGACIQCYKSNCYQAFHVTCARKAKFYMKMKHYTHQGVDYTINKAYCHKHSPQDHEHDLTPFPQAVGNFDDSSDDYNDSLEDLQLQQAAIQNAVAQRKGYPTLRPIAPEYVLQKLGERLDRDKIQIGQKQKFLIAACKYWALKRQSRRGAPLLKRLHLEPWTSFPSATQESEDIRKQRYAVLLKLRNDLESVRLLSEMVRKRERDKLKALRVQKQLLQFKFSPITDVLRQFLLELEAVDKQQYFKYAVSAQLVPDYYDFVKVPVDFGIILQRIDDYSYQSIDAFEKDVRQLILNCVIYNKPDTVFVKVVRKIEETLNTQLEWYQQSHKIAIQNAKQVRKEEILDYLHGQQ